MDHNIFAHQQDNSPPIAENSSQKQRRFPKFSIRILKRWVTTNGHNLRPNEAQKSLLQEHTGLTVQQISTWFANARRRGVDRSASSQVYGMSSTASISVPNIGQTYNWETMNPLERWRNSPPDQEPTSLSVILDAVSSNNSASMNFGMIGNTAHSFTQSETHRALSETSFESITSFWTTGSSSSAVSEQFDAHSASSTHYVGTPWPKYRARRRRGREGHQIFPKKVQRDNQSRLYQCTFCTDTFKTKYDWTRHESSLHFSLEKWTCAPLGATYYDEVERVSRCIFCDEINPNGLHAQSHNYNACSQKPHAERSFRRKDHLRQHLRLIHGIKTPPKSLATWKTTAAHIKSRCGFCGEHFEIWSDRNEHIADHFRDGIKMKDWTGDRGLEPSVCLYVENAMPPYLIGVESHEFEPFSASRTAQISTANVGPERHDPTRFEDLTGQLVLYINSALRQGQLVNDETVRKQARLIMFGDDDAWNQTPADNAEWLRLFKSGLGLGATNTPAAVASTGPVDHHPLSTEYPASPYFEFQQHIARRSDIKSLDDSAIDHTDSIINPKSSLPLAWQTPECLAEFRQMQEEGLLSPATDLDSFLQALAMDKGNYLLPSTTEGGQLGGTHLDDSDQVRYNSLNLPDSKASDDWQWAFPDDLDPSPSFDPGQRLRSWKT